MTRGVFFYQKSLQKFCSPNIFVHNPEICTVFHPVSVPCHTKASDTFCGMEFAASGNMDVLSAILLKSLTLGPLALSSFATPPPGSAIIQHLPTEGVVTSLFGGRHHPILQGIRHHSGIDIANTCATIIYAIASGRVTRITRDAGYGLMVDIDHGRSWHSRYAHLSRVRVKRGDFVFSGAIIGKMGESGMATGNHLHFELRHNGLAVNPAPHLMAAASIIAHDRVVTSIH